MNEDFFNLSDLKLEDSTLEQITNTEEIVDNTNTSTEEDKDVSTTETEDKQTEKDTDKAPTSESKDDSSTFSVFANLLKEEGVISLDEEEIKDIDLSNAKGLVDLVKKQLDKSRFENLSDSQKRYLEAVEAGIPQQEFERLEKQLAQLEAISDEVIDNNQQARFDLIAHDFIARGIDKEKAVKMANNSIKAGTDIEDAKEALDSLIKSKTEEYKTSVLSKKEDNKISLEKLKQTIDSKEVILKDIKLTPKAKTDLYNLLSVKVDSDDQGQPMNEFNKWRKDNGLEAEIILGAIYQATNKFQNLGKILDTAKSKSSLELEKKLRQNEVNDTVNTFALQNKDYTINI